MRKIDEQMVYAVVTVQGGVPDGIAGIFNTAEEATNVANEYRSYGHDMDVMPYLLGKTNARVTANGDVAPVKITLCEGDGIAPESGQVIRSGRTVAEAVKTATEDIWKAPLLTFFDGRDIQVSKDDRGRTVVEFTGRAAQHIAENAKKAILDTKSKIKNGRGKPVDKFTANLGGQIGEAAGQIFIHGISDGWQRYITERNARNANPYAGDGGVDALTTDGQKIDFKSSLLRSGKADPDKLNLIVAPKERHAGTTYVLVLCHKAGYDHFVARIVGSCHESDLPDQPINNPQCSFSGKYAVQGNHLDDPYHLTRRSSCT